jgi:single-stranded-DNA-specific exonuclease
MLGALEACAGHLEKFGGHRMAAGITLTRDRIKAFRAAMGEIGDGVLSPDDLRPKLRIDAPMAFRGITDRFYEDLLKLAPFGNANPRPVFVTRSAEVTDGPRRLKERHLSLGLRHDGVVLRGLFWRAAEREPAIAASRASLDLAYSVDQNTFNGRTSLELTLADVKAGTGLP